MKCLRYCSTKVLTVQSNNAEDKDQGQNKDNNGVDLQARRLIRVQLCNSSVHIFVRYQRPRARSSRARRDVVTGANVLSMVLLEPPAPADRVLVGRTFAIFSFWSAAARLRMAVRAPPGGVGDEGRPTLAPLAAVAAASGEEARGEDYMAERVSFFIVCFCPRSHGDRLAIPSSFNSKRVLVCATEVPAPRAMSVVE